MTRAEGQSIVNRIFGQHIYIECPNIKSMANLILLKKYYYNKFGKYIFSHNKMRRLRDRWITKQLEDNKDEMGGLTCNICGKKGLEPFVRDEKKMATLDHIIRIKDGGSWNDPSNFQIACFKCNTDKN